MTKKASVAATTQTTVGAPARDGRGSQRGVRQAKIDVRFTPQERARIDRRASSLGVRPSSWVRAVVLDNLDARADYVRGLEEAMAEVPVPDPVVARLVEQLRRVGVNLNQALRRGLVEEDVVVPVRDTVEELRAVVGDGTSLYRTDRTSMESKGVGGAS